MFFWNNLPVCPFSTKKHTPNKHGDTVVFSSAGTAAGSVAAMEFSWHTLSKLGFYAIMSGMNGKRSLFWKALTESAPPLGERKREFYE